MRGSYSNALKRSLVSETSSASFFVLSYLDRRQMNRIATVCGLSTPVDWGPGRSIFRKLFIIIFFFPLAVVAGVHTVAGKCGWFVKTFTRNNYAGGMRVYVIPLLCTCV